VKTEAPSLQNFNLDQTFFGFNPEDRKILHNILFDLIWIGDGRWDWNTVYTLPVFLRRYWIDQLNRKNAPEPKPTKTLATAPIITTK
jgi:hypothetical protein